MSGAGTILVNPTVFCRVPDVEVDEREDGTVRISVTAYAPHVVAEAAIVGVSFDAEGAR